MARTDLLEPPMSPRIGPGPVDPSDQHQPGADDSDAPFSPEASPQGTTFGSLDGLAPRAKRTTSDGRTDPATMNSAIRAMGSGAKALQAAALYGITNQQDLAQLRTEAFKTLARVQISLTEHAKRASTLQELEQILGTPPDADGRGGSGIRALPKSMQAEPSRPLSGRHLFVPREHRGLAAALLASHAANLGDPEAIERLTRNFVTLPHNADTTAAVRTIWPVVNQLPLEHRTLALHGLTASILNFPVSEQAARFREHLSAWEELVETMPDSLRSTRTSISALDAVLPNVVAYLPSDFQAEAAERIAAMKKAVYG
jgi:hypothetical protein